MSNDEPTFFVRVRRFVGGIAWRVYLWAIHMNDEQYNFIVHYNCAPENGAVPPMKYWQHDETGRVHVASLRPSDRWHEITAGEEFLEEMEPEDGDA